MSTLVLKVSPEEVKAKANQINAQKAQMQNYLKQMLSKVNQLQSAWDSVSGKNYTTKFQSVGREINDSLNALQKHTNNLVSVADEYSKIETQNKSKVNALSTENIF